MELLIFAVVSGLGSEQGRTQAYLLWWDITTSWELVIMGLEWNIPICSCPYARALALADVSGLRAHVSVYNIYIYIDIHRLYILFDV